MRNGAEEVRGGCRDNGHQIKRNVEAIRKRQLLSINIWNLFPRRRHDRYGMKGSSGEYHRKGKYHKRKKKKESNGLNTRPN